MDPCGSAHAGDIGRDCGQQRRDDVRQFHVAKRTQDECRRAVGARESALFMHRENESILNRRGDLPHG